MQEPCQGGALSPEVRDLWIGQRLILAGVYRLQPLEAHASAAIPSLWCCELGAETVAEAAFDIRLASFSVTLRLSGLKTGNDFVFDQQPLNRTLGLLPAQFQITFPTAWFYH
jgi:hypothetical protein